MQDIGNISTKNFQFEWTINDFFSYTEEGSSIYFSPDFSVQDSTWHIGLYPYGEKEDLKEYVSLFLRKVDEVSVTAEYRIGIKTSNSIIDFEKRGCNTFCESSCGWPKFIKRSELLERKSELVPSGTLTMTCFVKITNGVFDFESSYSKLAKNLEDLFISKDICDVTLHVKDESIEAHRTVLAARSSVFAAMFINDTLEKKTGVVKIPDADPKSFNVFLNFLYSAEIKFSDCNACELYKISHKYDVPDLKLVCVNFIAQNLTMENFCEALMLSHQFEENELYAEIKDFFKKNFEKIVSSDSWEIFLENNCRLCNNLLKSVAKNVTFQH